MKIGIITSSPIPPLEGIGHFVINLGRSLLAAGHSVSIFTRGYGLNISHLILNGLDIYKVGYLPIYPFHVYFHQIFLQQFIESVYPPFDVLDFQSPLVPAIDLGVPSIATIHTLLVPAAQKLERVGLMNFLIKLQSHTISRNLEESLFTLNPLVCSVRQIEPIELQSYRKKPARVIPIGVGVHNLFLESLNGAQKSQPPYIFYAGRLDYNKGIQDLIRSVKFVLAERPDVRFKLAGEGQLQAILEKTAAADGVASSVEFLGPVRERNDMRRLHRGAALYVQPSMYEGLPASILEAMASGTPVVYTDIPGARQLITPEEGAIVPPGQPIKLAEAILDILSDDGRRKRMGQSCREKVLSNYTWEIVGQRVLDCYLQAIAESGSG
jgi:glycosyltransferase involved in cell wall biosynthesis